MTSGVIAADLPARPVCAQAQDWPTRPMTLVVPFAAAIAHPEPG
jgi:tripartite-type tricarboxylate transporter receptor subunit TctC